MAETVVVGDLRALDALVELKVFGTRPPSAGEVLNARRYSTSIAEAWLVVERMESPAEQFHTVLRSTAGGKCWYCNFAGNSAVNLEHGWAAAAESAPIAIALAALRAKGVEVELQLEGGWDG